METNVDNPSKELVDLHKNICAGYDITCVYKNLKVPSATAASAQNKDGTRVAGGAITPEGNTDERAEEPHEDEIHAVTKISAHYKGFATRKQVKLERQETEAATTIQAGFRGAKAKQRVAQERDNQKMSHYLDQFRPFELLNSCQCVIRLDKTGIKYFEKLESWQLWQEAIKTEFPNKKISSVLYSVHKAPNDFANNLTEDLITSLHRFRKLETLMNLILVDRANQAKIKAARQAQLEQQQKEREEAGGDMEEEQEEVLSPKTKKFSRKQREALEMEEKAKRQREKIRRKENADVEQEYNILVEKLARFLEVDGICVEFAG